MNRPEKLRSDIIQLINDWIKDGMEEADFTTSKIDEMIAEAVFAAVEEEREECAKIAAGENYHERYRTWPWWKMADGCGNRGNDSDIVRHADDIAAAIRNRKGA